MSFFRFLKISFIIFLFTSYSIANKISEKDLKYVMPDAKKFVFFNEKVYPHWKAYDKKKNLIGICFLTTDVKPEIKGYVGPITILVGLYTNRSISGIKIIKHSENIAEANRIKEDWFQNQFRKKELKDKFEIGSDIQGITGATVTVKAVLESIKVTSEIIIKKYFGTYTDTSKKSLNLEAEEDLILNPKWGIQNIEIKLIKREMREGNLSEKEAYDYKDLK